MFMRTEELTLECIKLQSSLVGSPVHERLVDTVHDGSILSSWLKG